MSELQKTFARAKLAGLPPVFPPSFDEREEETDNVIDHPLEHRDDDSSSSASSASSASSTGTIKPTLSSKIFARPMGAPNKRSMSQIPWTTYFERELYLEDKTEERTIRHHVFLTSPTAKGPLFVMHHGAGSSGLSFAVLASEIRKLLPTAGVLSVDARGHGLTTMTFPSSPGPIGEEDPNHPTLDLSLSALSADLIFTINATKEAMSWPTVPPLVLVGHSVGGAVVTDVARTGALGNALLGYANLDIVEQTAVDALAGMTGFLATRPPGFPSIEAAIQWHLRNNSVRNAISARVSVPALLKQNVNNTAHLGPEAWIWRTDLHSTQPYWEGWFTGLSKKFLEAKGGKLLILAGTDRLDKEMMIGQMQGKYALQVFPEAGHFLHEDLPERTANVLVEFYKRNDRSALVLPPKVSDLLKAGKKV